ncbi:MAG: T9SS C-terminal target domain-containing protein, partial [Bacteroidetes bacterium]
NPTVTYSSPGTYDVQLAVAGPGGLDTLAHPALVHVVSPPSASLAPLPSLCADAPILTLSGGIPAGGTYSGTAVSGGTFDPALAGPGSHVVTYTYTDTTGCSDQAQANLVVHAVPLVTLAPFDPWCEGAGPLPLSGGSPAGGMYSGPGVAGGSLDPSLTGSGPQAIIYSYTNSEGCQAADTALLIISPTPVLSWSGPADLCQETAALTLNPGSPAGGTFLGPGISGSSFDPASAGAGTHALGYAYGENGCHDTIWSDLTVWPTPPAPTFTVNGLQLISSIATGNQWYVDGQAVSGANEPIFAVGDSGLYQVAYTDSLGCTSPLSEGHYLGPYGTSIEGHLMAGLWLFPNPADHSLQLRVPSRPGQVLRIRLFALTGQAVYQQTATAASDTWEATLPTRDIASGLYLLEVSGTDRPAAYRQLEVRH